jgi:hypothetical protein
VLVKVFVTFLGLFGSFFAAIYNFLAKKMVDMTEGKMAMPKTTKKLLAEGKDVTILFLVLVNGKF